MQLQQPQPQPGGTFGCMTRSASQSPQRARQQLQLPGVAPLAWFGKMFAPDDEVLYMRVVEKVNKQRRRQRRALILTYSKVVLMGPDGKVTRRFGIDLVVTMKRRQRPGKSDDDSGMVWQVLLVVPTEHDLLIEFTADDRNQVSQQHRAPDYFFNTLKQLHRFYFPRAPHFDTVLSPKEDLFLQANFEKPEGYQSPKPILAQAAKARSKSSALGTPLSNNTPRSGSASAKGKPSFESGPYSIGSNLESLRESPPGSQLSSPKKDLLRIPRSPDTGADSANGALRIPGSRKLSPQEMKYLEQHFDRVVSQKMQVWNNTLEEENVQLKLQVSDLQTSLQSKSTDEQQQKTSQLADESTLHSELGALRVEVEKLQGENRRLVDQAHAFRDEAVRERERAASALQQATPPTGPQQPSVHAAHRRASSPTHDQSSGGAAASDMERADTGVPLNTSTSYGSTGVASSPSPTLAATPFDAGFLTAGAVVPVPAQPGQARSAGHVLFSPTPHSTPPMSPAAPAQQRDDPAHGEVLLSGDLLQRVTSDTGRSFSVSRLTTRSEFALSGTAPGSPALHISSAPKGQRNSLSLQTLEKNGSFAHSTNSGASVGMSRTASQAVPSLPHAYATPQRSPTGGRRGWSEDAFALPGLSQAEAAALAGISIRTVADLQYASLSDLTQVLPVPAVRKLLAAVGHKAGCTPDATLVKVSSSSPSPPRLVLRDDAGAGAAKRGGTGLVQENSNLRSMVEFLESQIQYLDHVQEAAERGEGCDMRTHSYSPGMPFPAVSPRSVMSPPFNRRIAMHGDFSPSIVESEEDGC